MVQPIRSELIERGSKHLARGTLGPWAQGVGSLSPGAPAAVQAERRLVWRTIACPPKDQPRSWLRLLEQGPESQPASWICSVGPSSVMNASDLDVHSFVPSRHKVIGIKAHCLQASINRCCGWRGYSHPCLNRMAMVVTTRWESVGRTSKNLFALVESTLRDCNRTSLIGFDLRFFC